MDEYFNKLVADITSVNNSVNILAESFKKDIISMNNTLSFIDINQFKKEITKIFDFSKIIDGAKQIENNQIILNTYIQINFYLSVTVLILVSVILFNNVFILCKPRKEYNH